MTRLLLRCLRPDSDLFSDLELPVFSGCSAVRLWRVPGADAIQVPIVADGTVVCRAEIPAESSDYVDVEIEWSSPPRVTSAHHSVLLLPLDERYAAPAARRPANTSGELDVAILIDGTTRLFSITEDTSRPLLAHPAAWGEHVEQLRTLVGLLAAGVALKASVMAFGDGEPPDVAADDLLNALPLFPAAPEERALMTCSPEDARDRMMGLRASSGGDFVDALAEGLATVAGLRWRASARKILILFGDSPGHSIYEPLPRGADLGARRADVDSEAARLDAFGIDLVTIYCAPAAASGKGEDIAGASLIKAARRQYRRLASWPALAWEADSLDPAVLAEFLLNPPDVVTRGAGLGVWRYG